MQGNFREPLAGLIGGVDDETAEFGRGFLGAIEGPFPDATEGIRIHAPGCRDSAGAHRVRMKKASRRNSPARCGCHRFVCTDSYVTIMVRSVDQALWTPARSTLRTRQV
jgi:hypothetical protein